MTEVDLSAFEAHMRPSGPRCLVGEALGVFKPAKRAQLQEALDRQVAKPGRKRITNPAIVRWLKDEGFETTITTVGRHRRKECDCG